MPPLIQIVAKLYYDQSKLGIFLISLKSQRFDGG